jgi:hypothetical protein
LIILDIVFFPVGGRVPCFGVGCVPGCVSYFSSIPVSVVLELGGFN